MSILASYSFVNIPSTARASTPQLFLMALGLAVHVAQSVAVFGMMEAAWSRFVVRKSHHLDSWGGAFGLFVGFTRHRTKNGQTVCQLPHDIKIGTKQSTEIGPVSK